MPRFVNPAHSLLSCTVLATTLLAMMFGFNTVLTIAFVFYMAALLALRVLTRPTTAAAG